MTRVEFEQYYKSELEGVEARRYHILFPLNIRTFEGNGWKYKGYEQKVDGWMFIGSEERVRNGDKLFRVWVPKDPQGELVWEWDWQRNESVKDNKKIASTGPQTQVSQS